MNLDIRNLKMEIYTPPEYVASLRNALNALGACHVGNYDHVISYQNSKGCWRPLEGSHPFSGKTGSICYGEEIKMELICPVEIAAKAVSVIKNIHPYEEPVIHLIPLIDPDDLITRL